MPGPNRDSHRGETAISLTQRADGWIAIHEQVGISHWGETRERALSRIGVALDQGDADASSDGEVPVQDSPGHPFRFIETAPIGIVHLNGNLNVTYVNEWIETELVSGHSESPEQPLGQHVTAFFESTDVRDEQFSQLQDGEEIRFEVESISGGMAVLGRGTPHFTNGEFDGATVAFVEISELKAHVRELEEDANLLDQIFKQIPASLYVKNTEGQHVRISHYDSDPDEVIGKTDLEIYGVELARDSFADDMHVIETGDPVINREEYNPENGEWTLTSKVPWYGPDGEVQGLIGVTRFITERKEYEQALKREKERFERFASVVSHDLRNPLNIASGNVDLLQESYDDPALDTVGSALARMAELIEDALTLARQGETIGTTEQVTLSEVVHAAWRSIDSEDAELRLAGECTFHADRSRVVQMFENLARNAIEHGLATDIESAAKGDSILTIRVGPVAEQNGFYFEDDGQGIPAEERDEIFETGYSTADTGTGFGLSIVHEIIKAHGWEIQVTDGPDGGARFVITGIELAGE